MTSTPHLPCPEPGWVPVDPFPAGSADGSFVSGATAAVDRTRVAYYRQATSDHLFACVWFGPASEGPPDSVHGGAIAAVLDETMGAACWANGHPAVAARITIDFRHLVPVGFSGRVEAWIDHVERRKVSLAARLTDADGRVLAEGEALFITLLPEQLRVAAKRRASDPAGRDQAAETGSA